MKLINKVVETVITETFTIELKTGKKIIAIDYLDERGKVIDSVIRDEHGNNIDDPIIYEEVISFLEHFVY